MVASPAGWTIAALIVVAAGLLLSTHNADAQAIISQGDIAIGVQATGQLTVNGGPTSSNCKNTQTSLQYLPTKDEAMDCDFEGEGWGMTYAGGPLAVAYKNDAFLWDTSVNQENACNHQINPSNPNPGAVGPPWPNSPPLSATSFASTGTTATSVVQVGEIKTTQKYQPKSGYPNVYQDRITIENTGTVPHDNILYRRVMSWGSAGANDDATYESIGLVPPLSVVPATVVRTGIVRLSVCPAPGFPTAYTLQGPPNAPPVVQSGPDDSAMVWDFNFGSLGPGDSRSFSLYYGAGSNLNAAKTTLQGIEAEFANIDESNGHSSVTFFMAFGGLSVPPTLAIRPNLSTGASNSCGGAIFDAQFSSPPAPTVVYQWSASDGYTSDQAVFMHKFANQGNYVINLVATDGNGNQLTAPQLSINVNNCPPTAHYTVAKDALMVSQLFRFSDDSTDDDSPASGVPCGTPGHRIASWRWDFGDGTESTMKAPTHAYTTLGPKTVRLYVTDCDGLASQKPYARNVLVQPNTAPTLTGLGKYAAFSGHNFAIILGAFDPDLDQGLTLQLCDKPTVGTLDPTIAITYPTAEGSPTVQATYKWDSIGSVSRSFTFCIMASDGELTTHGVFELFVLTPTGDADLDGIADGQDNCPAESNRDQADADDDGSGDACDVDRAKGPADAAGALQAQAATTDHDADGIDDRQDNCPSIGNKAQTDADGDGIGDACDLDVDGDLIANAGDNCAGTPNTDQRDADGDGAGDRCDAEPNNANLGGRMTNKQAQAPHGADAALILARLGLGGLAVAGIVALLVALVLARARRG